MIFDSIFHTSFKIPILHAASDFICNPRRINLNVEDKCLQIVHLTHARVSVINKQNLAPPLITKASETYYLTLASKKDLSPPFDSLF